VYVKDEQWKEIEVCSVYVKDEQWKEIEGDMMAHEASFFFRKRKKQLS